MVKVVPEDINTGPVIKYSWLASKTRSEVYTPLRLTTSLPDPPLPLMLITISEVSSLSQPSNTIAKDNRNNKLSFMFDFNFKL